MCNKLLKHVNKFADDVALVYPVNKLTIKS